MGMVTEVTANLGPFCSKDFSSGVSSFLERLFSYLSWILEEVEEVTAVLKVLVVLEAILEVVLEDLEMRCFSFLVWVLLYCRRVFSLLLKIMFCRSVKVHLDSVAEMSWCLLFQFGGWSWYFYTWFYFGWENNQLSLLWPVQTYCLSIWFARFLVLCYLLGIWD